VAYGLAGLGDPRKCMPSLLTSAADLDAALDGHRTEPVAAPWRDALAAVRAPQALKG
jgi:hypothetical protein